MKLGTETGSMVNHIYSRSVIGQPVPEVGMGATILSWTDRNPGTIVSVECNKNGSYLVGVAYDDYRRVDNNGMSEEQDYEYLPIEGAEATNFYKAKSLDDDWRAVRKNDNERWVYCSNGGLIIGKREKYHDFSF